jgi:putative ABC transport system substrate-binding protein
VQSLSHPGGNITGFAYLERTIGAKWLSLLTEIAPNIRRLAYIYNPKAGPYAHFYYEAEVVAGNMGVQLDIDPVNDPAEFEPICPNSGPPAVRSSARMPSSTTIAS